MPLRKFVPIFVSMGLVLACAAVCRFAGFRTVIPWDFYQFLDRELLTQRPIESLLLLHSQPPLLNGVLAALISLSKGLVVPVEHLCLWFNVGLVLLCVGLLHRLAFNLTRSHGLALLAVLMVLFDPATHLHLHLYFYELPALVGQIAVMYFAVAWLRGRRPAEIYCFVVALAFCALLRTLYGPIWAMVLFATVILLDRSLRSLPWRGTLRPAIGSACLLAILLSLWPLKNYLLFGRFTNSTWIGFNLCRGPKIRDPRLQRFLEEGVVPAEAAPPFRVNGPFQPKPNNSLTQVNRSDGTRNWNHWIFLVVDGDLRRQAFFHYVRHPLQWMDKARSYYLRWGRPCATNSYTEAPLFVPHDLAAGYLAYERWYSALFHFNLRSLSDSGRPVPSVGERPDGRRPPTSWPIYSVVFLPALFILTLRSIRRSGRRKSWRVSTRLLLAVMAILPMVIVCLTDGAEGNRMRYSTTGATVLLLVLLMNDARLWRKQRTNQLRAAIIPPKSGTDRLAEE